MDWAKATAAMGTARMAEERMLMAVEIDGWKCNGLLEGWQKRSKGLKAGYFVTESLKRV